MFALTSMASSKWMNGSGHRNAVFGLQAISVAVPPLRIPRINSQFLGDGSDTRCRIIPYAMFTDPELGRVGVNETEARRTGKQFRVGLRRMTDSGKAPSWGKTAGFIKAIVDAKTDEILGATALCEHGSEIVQPFVELMNGGATARMVRDVVHIHPTLAEAAKNAVVDVIEEGSGNLQRMI